jgi:hypothetical protein
MMFNNQYASEIVAQQQQLAKIPILIPSLLFGLASCYHNPTLLESQRKPGQRPLTSVEIGQLRQELHQTIAQLPETSRIFPTYRDRRTSEEKQKIAAFQQGWAMVNPTIAPFLGFRAVTNIHRVYPSLKPGQVCVAYTYGDSAGSNFGSVLSIGQVKDGQIFTNNNEILFLESSYLAMMVVDSNDKPALFIFPHPTPYNSEFPPLQDFEEQLQILGCTMQSAPIS